MPTKGAIRRSQRILEQSELKKQTLEVQIQNLKSENTKLRVHSGSGRIQALESERNNLLEENRRLNRQLRKLRKKES